MKKIIFAFVFFILTTITVNAKETLQYVLAGSPSGTFNSYNAELIKDLNEYYNVVTIPGQSEVKGGRIYESINKGAVFVMVRSGLLNGRSKSSGSEPAISTVDKNFLIMGIRYYKALCILPGRNVSETVLSEGNTLKIGLDDGVKVGNKFVDNLNRVTNSQNIFVPFRGSGKNVQGIITGDTDVGLINEAKAAKFIASGQISCDLSTNPNGGNGFKSLKSQLNDDWFGWEYGNLILGQVKNVDKEFAKELHATILKIYQDPNSNASKRLKKNGWFGLTIEQDELFDAYQENFDHTIKLLK